MNEPGNPTPEAGNSSDQHRLEADRREFVRRALGLGVFALGSGPALGHSLLLRSLAPVSPWLFDSSHTTLTDGRSNVWTQTDSLGPTDFVTGVKTQHAGNETGTYTTSATPLTYSTLTYTQSAPAPGGTSQPVTIAQTYEYSFTPPATTLGTVSWDGDSYTITNSHTVTLHTYTVTSIRSVTYTWTTTTKNGCPEPPVTPDSIEVARNGGDEALVESIDALGVDLRDAHTRIPRPLFLRLACSTER